MFWLCEEMNAVVELTEAGFMRFNKESGDFTTLLTPSEIDTFCNGSIKSLSASAAFAFEDSKASKSAKAL